MGAQIPLYRVKTDDTYTIHPQLKPSVPLFYRPNGTITATSASDTRVVYATELPLFVFTDHAGKPYEDVWPHQPQVAASATLSSADTWPALDAPVGNAPQDPMHTGLPRLAAPGQPGIAMGHHFECALFGERGAATTGLTIRERGRQNTSFRWAQAAETPAATATGLVEGDVPEPAGFADNTSFIRAYVAWLKSNYVVYWARTPPVFRATSLTRSSTAAWQRSKSLAIPACWWRTRGVSSTAVKRIGCTTMGISPRSMR